MSGFLNSTATLGKYVVLHVVAAAIIITGVVMLLSATELGPVAAFIVALGLYMVIFGVCIELLFGLRCALAFGARLVVGAKQE